MNNATTVNLHMVEEQGLETMQDAGVLTTRIFHLYMIYIHIYTLLYYSSFHSCFPLPPYYPMLYHSSFHVLLPLSLHDPHR